jgi:aminoglycoside phosphotransferase family enzyme/predicted kinase
MGNETGHDPIPGMIRGLLDPAAFPHTVQDLQIIETHISWVILTGEFVYKIKKPVSLGFLDFSTLERRKFFCEEEVRLNRRTAPELYLDVVPIGEAPVGLRMGTEPAIEYAVRMRQFPSDARLDQRLAAGLLATEDMRALAVMLARFHQALPPRENIDSALAAVKAIRPARKNFSHLHPELFGDDSRQVLANIEAWTRQQSTMLEPVFEARARNGFIRECHGDLHLSNLVELEGRIVLFDCIEFNPELRWIDTASDIAFLVMDLMAHERADLAYSFLNAWLEENGDYDSLEVLRFYLVYRCMVRVIVASIQFEQSQRSSNNGDRVDAHRYLELARFLVQAPVPRLILMHGLSGSGKTWLSEKLVSTIPAIRVRSDLERKRLHGELDTETGLYGREATESTYQLLLRHCETGLQAGFDMIADATFLRRRHRLLFLDLAARLDVQPLILDCAAPVATLQSRIRQRAAAKKDASDADLAVLQQQLEDHDELDERENRFAIPVATDEITDQSIAELVSAITRG